MKGTVNVRRPGFKSPLFRLIQLFRLFRLFFLGWITRPVRWVFDFGSTEVVILQWIYEGLIEEMCPIRDSDY
jgi:hypothetical protein